MIEFAESKIDMMGNVTRTPAQVMRQWDRELARKWPKVVQMNLRDFIEIKDEPGADQLPQYAENVAMLESFIQDKQTCYIRRVQDVARNQLLIDTIAYERALVDVQRLSVKIEGQEYIAPTEEVTDPETGEVTTPYSPGQREVIAIPPTIEQVNEEQQTVEVDNPAYVEAVAARDAAQAIVDNVSQEVLELVGIRAEEPAPEN